MPDPAMTDARKKELAAGLAIDPPTRFFYNIRGIALGFLRLLGPVTVRGKENVPATGAFILASNHRAHVDPPLLSAICPRQPYFMGKEELFHGVIGFFVKRLGVFPVRRGAADRAALRKAIDLLEAGKIVAIFPEGTRSEDKTLGPPEKGFGMIAKMADALILPVSIEGSELFLPKGSKTFHRGKVVITVGKPFRTSDVLAEHPGAGKEALTILGKVTMERIQALMVDPVPMREKSEEPADTIAAKKA